jgi:hypothetical protein
METRILVTICGILLFLSIEGFGQSNPIIWESQSVKNLRNNEEHGYECTFRIFPAHRIEWIQGTVTFDFAITSTEGVLQSEGPGTITYTIIKEGHTGKLIVQRGETGSTVLTLDLANGADTGAYLRFNVTLQ